MKKIGIIGYGYVGKAMTEMVKGKYNVLVFDPQDSHTLYLGSQNRGLFISIDSAETWSEIKRLPQGSVGAVAVHPLAKHIVYVAVDNKIYKTTDANRTWSNVYLDGDLNRKVTALKINKDASDLIFAGISDGRLIKSNNGGQSWTNLENFEKKIKNILISPYDWQIMYLVVEGKGIYYSSDAGENWSSLEKNYKEFCRAGDVKDLYFVPGLPYTLVMTTKKGILKSRNSGENWTEYNLLSPKDDLEVYALGFNPQNPEMIYYTTRKTFYESIDGGEHWTPKSLPSKIIAEKILIDPLNPNIFYLGMGGIIK